MPVALGALATVAADAAVAAGREAVAVDEWVESDGDEPYELDADRKAIWDLRSKRDRQHLAECTHTTHTTHITHSNTTQTTNHTHHTTQGVVRLPGKNSTSVTGQPRRLLRARSWKAT